VNVPEFKRVALKYAGENEIGGALHIVTDDGNLDDSHVEWCITYAVSQDDYYGAALALLLMQMTRTQRGKVSKEWYDWHDEWNAESRL
jgi:hypothetical protein